MRTDLEKRAKVINNRRKWHNRWLKVVGALAAVTVFCTTYALILPAITISTDAYCGHEEHEHTDECYTLKLVCGLEESEGTAAYTPEPQEVVTVEIEKVLVDEGHVHTEACYEEEVLICEEEEREAVYEEVEVEVVTLVEQEEVPAVEGHKHTESCYERVLLCEKEEHHHGATCFADRTADIESPIDWEKTLPQKDELKGDWKADTLAIAKSQLGYRESEVNFVVEEDEHKGYTRYGAMFGVPHGDWCAMFVQFCMHYAGVDTEIMAGSPSVPTWVKEVKENKNFFKAGEYEPQATDLIFFDYEQNDSADHIGIVEEIVKNEKGEIEEIITIEGNSGDEVRRNTYKADDENIYGFAAIPEKPVTEEAPEVPTTSIEFEMGLGKAEVEAVIFTDETYTTVAEDTTKIFVEGELPVVRYTNPATGQEVEEVAVEVKAYPIDMEDINGGKMILSYDITIFYNPSYVTEETGEIFQPVTPVNVSFESPLLAANGSGSKYSVYHTPEGGEAELVATGAGRTANGNSISESAEGKVTVVPELTEEEKALAERFDSSAELEKHIIKEIKETKEYATLVAGSINPISDDLASVLDGDLPSFSMGVNANGSDAVVTNEDEDVFQLIVEKSEGKGRVTFEAAHFSPYAVAESVEAPYNPIKIGLQEGDDESNGYSNRSDESQVESFSVTEGGNAVEVHSPFKNQTINIKVTAQAANQNNTFKVGDYFRVALPAEFDFTPLTDATVRTTNNGNGFEGIGRIAYIDGLPYMDLEITKAGTVEPYKVSFETSITVPFDFNRNNVGSGKTFTATAQTVRTSGAVPKTVTIQMGTYDESESNRNLNADTDLVSLGVFGWNLNYSNGMSEKPVYQGQTNTIYSLNVSFNWKRNQTVLYPKSGDYFEIDMPAKNEGLIYRDPYGYSYNIRLGNDIIAVADYNDSTGKVRVTFNENIAKYKNYSSISGSFPINIYYTSTGMKTLTAKVSGKNVSKSTSIRIGEETVVAGTWKTAEYPYYYELSGYTATTYKNGARHYSKGLTTFLLYPAGSKPNWNSIKNNQQWYKADGTDPYAVVYCADHEQDYVVSTYYKYPMMQAPNTSLSETQKKKASGIVKYSYPYISARAMYDALGEYDSSIRNLSPDEDVAIAATQLALWSVINGRTLAQKDITTTELNRGGADYSQYILKLRPRVTGAESQVYKVYNALINNATNLYNKDDAPTTNSSESIYVIKSNTAFSTDANHKPITINSAGDMEYWVELTLSRQLNENSETLVEFKLSAASSNEPKYTTIVKPEDIINDTSSNFEWIDRNAAQPRFRMKVVVPVNETRINFSGSINGAPVKTVTPYYYYNGYSQSMIGAECSQTVGQSTLDDFIPIVPEEEPPTPPSGDITIEVKVEKKWYEEDGVTEIPWNDSSLPNSITVQLFQNGVYYGQKELTKAGQWKASWGKLKYKDAEGNRYVYTVKEAPVSGYISTFTDYGLQTITNNTEQKWHFKRVEVGEDISTAFGQWNRILIYSPGYGFLKLNRSNHTFEWVSEDDVNIRAPWAMHDANYGYDTSYEEISAFDGLVWDYSYFNFSSSANPYLTLGQGWSESGDIKDVRLYHDGSKYLLRSGADAYYGQFYNAQLYPTAQNEARMLKVCWANNAQYEYITNIPHGSNTIETNSSMNGAMNFYLYKWDRGYVEDSYYLLGLSNRKVGTTEVEVEKKWLDVNGNELLNPPSSLTVKLLQNGHVYGDPVTLTPAVDADGKAWHYKWTDLPIFDENGNKYNYQVTEEAPSGFNHVHTEIDIRKGTLAVYSSQGTSGGSNTGGGTGSVSKSFMNNTEPSTQTTYVNGLEAGTTFTYSTVYNTNTPNSTFTGFVQGNQYWLMENGSLLAYNGSGEPASTGTNSVPSTNIDGSADTFRKYLWTADTVTSYKVGSGYYAKYTQKVTFRNVYDPTKMLYMSGSLFRGGNTTESFVFCKNDGTIGGGYIMTNGGNGALVPKFSVYNVTANTSSGKFTTGSYPKQAQNATLPNPTLTANFSVTNIQGQNDVGQITYSLIRDGVDVTNSTKHTVYYEWSDNTKISIDENGVITPLSNGPVTASVKVVLKDGTVLGPISRNMTITGCSGGTNTDPNPGEDEPEQEVVSENEYVTWYYFTLYNKETKKIYELYLHKIASENGAVYVPTQISDDYYDTSRTPARFEFYEKIGDEWVILDEIEMVLNDQTPVVLSNLESGKEYKLVEIEAPPGRALLGKPVTFKIIEAQAGASYIRWNNEDMLTLLGSTSGGYIGTLLIPNDVEAQSYVMPETGGMGTEIFVGMGLLLIAAAGSLLVLKKVKASK